MMINMKIRKALFPFMALCGLIANGATITVIPGTLDDEIKDLPASESQLILQGTLDARDFYSLSNLPSSLKILDLSGVTFKKCSLASPSPEGRYNYADNELPAWLFRDSKLTQIVLPSFMTDIPEGFFAGSSLEKISLPAGCKTINQYAFYNCKDLSEITLPSSVKTIKNKAFAGCSNLIDINLPSGVILEGNEIFQQSGITSIDLSKTSSIGDYALAGAVKMTQTALNPAATYGEGVFFGDYSLVNISGVPQDLPSMFFTGVPFPKVSEFLQEVETIGPYAFAKSAITGIILTSSVKAISGSAFYNNSALTVIDANDLESNIPVVDADSFSGIDQEKISLYVTADSYDAWRNHPAWGKFNILKGDSHVEEIDNNNIAIKADRNLVVISSPDGVGKYAIVSPSGIILANGSSDETRVELDASAWNEQIIIVIVENNRFSRKSTYML